jgi:hypothetical protein
MDNVCILSILRIHEVISTEWLTLLSTSIKFEYGIIEKNYFPPVKLFDAPGPRPKVKVAQWTQDVMPVSKSIKNQVFTTVTI